MATTRMMLCTAAAATLITAAAAAAAGELRRHPSEIVHLPGHTVTEKVRPVTPSCQWLLLMMMMMTPDTYVSV